MNRILIVLAAGAGACAIAVPAVLGLSGNPSFSRRLPVRVPTSAHVISFDDRGKVIRHEPRDDHRRQHGTHTEPGDDRGHDRRTHTEPGDDRRTHTEPGDDRGRDERHGGDHRHRGRHGDA